MGAPAFEDHNFNGQDFGVEHLTLQLSMARDIDDILAVVRGHARHLVGADGITFVLRDGNMCHYAEEDAIAPLWKGQRFPLGCVDTYLIHRIVAAIVMTAR